MRRGGRSSGAWLARERGRASVLGLKCPVEKRRRQRLKKDGRAQVLWVAPHIPNQKRHAENMRWKRRRASWMPVGFWKVGPVGREDLDKVKFDSKNEREKLDGKNIEYKLIEIGWIGSRWVERMWTKVLFWRRSLISLTRIGLTEVEEVRLIEVSLPTGKFDRGI